MKLATLLAGRAEVEWRDMDLANSEVSVLTADSRVVVDGAVFVAVRGTGRDGHDYISQVASQCLALVIEDKGRVPSDYRGAVLVVENSRKALAELAAVWAHRPSRDLFIAGVTGTNGKTTTTLMIEHILNAAGWPTGVIGTIDHHLGARVWPTELTTPGPVELQSRLRDFLECGAKAVAFEVSSHALDQARADGIEFDVGVFTNFTRDHLDYHGDMETYFLAKSRLFSDLLATSGKPVRRAILNGNDQAAHRLKEMSAVPVWLTGEQADVDLRWTCKASGLRGSQVLVQTPHGQGQFELPIIGRHNIENAMGAIGAALVAGIPLEAVLRALTSLKGVRGRLQTVSQIKPQTVIVDYAHTDDALRTVLGVLRAAMGRGRLHVVFGCGGERDKGKRPLMLRAALAVADLILITSDNPRREDPEQIIVDIMAGATNPGDAARIRKQVDRRLAIREALATMAEEDVLLIAGKGHEVTQQIGLEKRPFDDVSVALDEWKSLGRAHDEG